MTLRAPLRLTFLIISGALTLHSQTAPPTPKPSPDVVAGIPVNYDEAKVGTYSLPDPLRLNNGKPVHDARTWYSKRRPEIVEMFETQQYGRAPGRPADESFEMVDPERLRSTAKRFANRSPSISTRTRPARRSIAHLSPCRSHQAGADVFQYQFRRRAERGR